MSVEVWQPVVIGGRHAGRRALFHRMLPGFVAVE